MNVTGDDTVLSATGELKTVLPKRATLAKRASCETPGVSYYGGDIKETKWSKLFVM